ncbi:Cell division cycle protein 23 [Thelohanellus kitauei]|uniref:Cell division cycle protein 23 n=1 Tax=Thelohanellus kitauei TaxID=669202 RepID=A0A0C2MZ40_THEKT|nr:Cell division cycle protein 23 [Thelohanellus kitauei]
MKDFFLIELEKLLDVTKLNNLHWDNFNNIGITESVYFKSFAAIKLTRLDLIENAKNAFVELYEMDPYNIDSIDKFSNILYLKNDYIALSKLVKNCFRFARYKPQTCFAVGTPFFTS